MHVVIDRHLITGQNDTSTLSAVQNLILLCNARSGRVPFQGWGMAILDLMKQQELPGSYCNLHECLVPKFKIVNSVKFDLISAGCLLFFFGTIDLLFRF